MRKLIRILVGVLILCLLGYAVYHVFIDVEKYNVDYNKYFALEEMDYAVVGEEVVVKLLNIKDDRCLDVSCEREGQYLVKVFIINNNKFTIVDLGTLEPTKVKIDKLSLEYTIELIEVEDGKTATLKLTKNDD